MRLLAGFSAEITGEILIDPRLVKFFVDSFESIQCFFGDLARLFIEAGIAEVDTATERPMLASRAASLYLIGTLLANLLDSPVATIVEKFGLLQTFRLHCSDIQAVAVFAKLAATPADLAAWRSSPYLGINPVVDFIHGSIEFFALLLAIEHDTSLVGPVLPADFLWQNDSEESLFRITTETQRTRRDSASKLDPCATGFASASNGWLPPGSHWRSQWHTFVVEVVETLHVESQIVFLGVLGRSVVYFQPQFEWEVLGARCDRPPATLCLKHRDDAAVFFG